MNVDAQITTAGGRFGKEPSATSVAGAMLPWLLSAFCAVGQCIVWRLRYPSLLGKSAMWAEEASNFFANAVSQGVWGNLKAVDFAYVPLLPRLVALLVHHLHVPALYVPLTYHWVSSIWSSVCVALFCTPWFRWLLRSDMARFVLCIGLWFHPDYEMKTLLTMSYYAAIPLFLLAAALPRARLRPASTVAASLSVYVVGLSKPALFGFGPAYGLLGSYFLWNRRWQPLAVCSALIVAFATQAAIMTAHPHAAAAGHSFSIGVVAKIVVQQLQLILASAALGGWTSIRSQLDTSPGLAAACAGAVTVLFAMTCILGQRKHLRWPLAVGTLTGLSTMLLTAASFPNVDVVSRAVTSHLGCRWWFVPVVLAYLLVGTLVADSLKSRLGAAGAASLFLLSSFPCSLKQKLNDAGWPAADASSWQDLGDAGMLASQGPLCLPINPYPWSLELGCVALAAPPSAEHAAKARPVAGPRVFSAPASAQGGSVLSLVAWMEPTFAARSRATAMDAAGNLLATATTVAARTGRFTTYSFSRPVDHVAYIMVDDSEVLPPGSNTATGDEDLVLWYGHASQVDGA